jgi:hypothetical protein
VGRLHGDGAEGFRLKKLTWTLVANGKTTQIPAGLDTLYEVAPFKDATNNTPPYLVLPSPDRL